METLEGEKMTNLLIIIATIILRGGFEGRPRVQRGLEIFYIYILYLSSLYILYLYSFITFHYSISFMNSF